MNPAAEREIRRLQAADAARLRRPIFELAFDPRPPTSAQVARTAYLRIRVGQLRIVYLVDEVARDVLIVRVARRSESTYRRL